MEIDEKSKESERFAKFFGKRIQEARISKGLSQKELGEILNLSSQAASEWERGNAYPSAITILKLSQVLDRPLDYFWGLDTTNFGDHSVESLEKAMQKVLLDFPTIKKREEDDTSIMEFSKSTHSTYPWGFFGQTRFLLERWANIAASKGFLLEYLFESSYINVISIKKYSDMPQSFNLAFCDDGFDLLNNCLFVLGRQFRRDSMKEFLDIFKIKSTFLESTEKDFWFGYETYTIKIKYDNEIYTPSIFSQGNNKCIFEDFGVLIFLKLNKVVTQVGGLPINKIASEPFDKIFIVAGAHRLATLSVAGLVSHKNVLFDLFDKYKESLGCSSADFSSSFEAVFQVKAESHTPLTTNCISLKKFNKIDLTL